MDLSDRKRRILNAVIRLHSDSGDPVGSHVLTLYLRDLSVSSATLRSEMAEMTSLGLLEQPHTSAGRVPTNEGMRYYLDHLLQRNPIDPGEKRAIEEVVFAMDSDPEKAAESSAKTLANALRLAAVATTPTASRDGIVHFELMRVGRYNIAVLGVSSLGSVKTRVCRVHSEIDQTALANIAAALNDQMAFVAGQDISHSIMESLAHSLGRLNAEARPILEAARQLVLDSNEVKVFSSGMHNLLHYSELDGSMREILELFSNSDTLETLLAGCTNELDIRLGDELGISGLRDLSLVAGSFHAGGGVKGTMGVIGPVRMNYAVVIPRLKYYCESVSELLTRAS